MDLLDMERSIEGNYRLEISSPGVDRPLRTSRDFGRAIGRKIRISMYDGTERPPVIVGRLMDVVEESLIVDSHQKQLAIPLDEVKEGKMEVEF
jgi:ribosome maturation factor RimP